MFRLTDLVTGHARENIYTMGEEGNAIIVQNIEKTLMSKNHILRFSMFRRTVADIRVPV